jgi:hypothetical protein
MSLRKENKHKKETGRGKDEFDTKALTITDKRNTSGI